ncbi:hypothetical protein PHISCL_04774 [Aspergillus sclerotialis]|uniref:Uncharacterized protein n=1 Tax=Aspergillus sclerotialis TaxID=2070753 RepID=A0A3A2ZI96_9EURO|nr:hypothetical protein PHISCL_04774 [Aspergillus sclerotialis]
MPERFFSFLKVDHDNFKENEKWKAFTDVFLRIADYGSDQSTTIDDIVSLLFKDGLITEDIGDQELDCIRYMVFSILGWQSMLYRPAAMKSDPEVFTIQDEQDGYRAQAYISLQQDICAGSRETLSEFLMGFGVPLASKNLCLSDNTDEQKASRSNWKSTPKNLMQTY